MKVIVIILVCFMVTLSQAEEPQLRALCFAYKGISDKPIANVILASNQEALLKAKTELLNKKLVGEKDFYLDIIVSNKELNSFDLGEIFKQDMKSGDFLIIFFYAKSWKACQYPTKEGLKCMKSLLPSIKDEATRNTLQKLFIARLEGLSEK